MKFDRVKALNISFSYILIQGINTLNKPKMINRK